MISRRLLLCGLAAFSMSPTTFAGTQPKIIVGTSLIADIVKDLLADNVELLTLVQSSTCPVHSDIKVSDVVFTSRSQLALIHSFQKNLPQLQSLLKAAANPSLKTQPIVTKGNWVCPPVQKEASKAVASILIAQYPHDKQAILHRLETRLNRIDNAWTESKATLKALQGVPVIAAYRQADFLQWAGLNVVTHYGQVEDLSPQTIINVVKTAKQTGVVGIVDNQQSGANIGLTIAKELKVKHVVLSNFPIENSSQSDYFSLYRSNLKTLSSLLNR